LGALVPEESEILARCESIARATDGQGDLEEAIADLHHLPAHLPLRGALAGQLIIALLRGRPRAGSPWLRHLDGLLEIADRNPPQLAEWPRYRASVRALALARAGAEGELSDPRAALAEWETLLPTAEDDPASALFSDSIRTTLAIQRALADGDEATLRRLPSTARELADRLRGLTAAPEAAALADVLPDVANLLSAQRRDVDTFSQFDQLRTSVERLPPGHDLRHVVDETSLLLDPFRGLLGEGDSRTPPTDEQLAAVVEGAQQPGLSQQDRALRHAVAGGAALSLGAETDPGRVDLSIRHLREAVNLAAPGEPNRAVHLFGLAFALYRRSELTGSVEDLDETAALLEQARRISSPGDSLWSGIHDMLSYLRRRRGPVEPGGIALEGLREYAWKVLIQSDQAAANLAARDAARSAVDTARQFVAFDNDPARAILALDAGRGLALFAATETHNVADRLDAAGRPDLARRWRAASASGKPEDLPTETRRDVLAAVMDSGTVNLLDPPSLGEIRDALVTLDADALVYLVLGKGHITGLAVIAPATGPPSFLALPSLQSETDLDFERYLTALARRDAALAGPERDFGPLEGQSEFLRSLDT
jgi:hypothetical protein